MVKMRFVIFIFFILVGISLISSGCLKEYNEIIITNTDVMSVSQESGTELRITPYIRNDQNTDSRALSVKVNIRDPSTNLIVTSKDTDLGYIKSNSQSHNTVSLFVTDPGEYEIEIQLYEGGTAVDNYHTHVTVKAELDVEQPSDVMLTDMTITVKQFVDGVTKVAVDVSPGIVNQGGDSEPLTMTVIANVDPHTRYTESDELGIVEGSNRVRGNVRMILPKNTEYTFTVKVAENGRTVFTGNTVEKIKLNEIRFNTPVTYELVEEGIPPVATKSPGFHGLIAISGILLVYGIISRTKNRR